MNTISQSFTVHGHAGQPAAHAQPDPEPAPAGQPRSADASASPASASGSATGADRDRHRREQQHGVIPNPIAVIYTSPNTTGTLIFTPVAGASGVTTITVIVKDNGGTANGGVNFVSQSFTVAVDPAHTGPRRDDHDAAPWLSPEPGRHPDRPGRDRHRLRQRRHPDRRDRGHHSATSTPARTSSASPARAASPAATTRRPAS